MSNPSFVYVTYIATTMDRLFRALTSAEFTERYMFGRRVESTWEVGAPVRYWGRDGTLSDTGTVLEAGHPLAVSGSETAALGEAAAVAVARAARV